MAVNSQEKSATKDMIVYRAGTKHGPSFDLKDKSLDQVWLVRKPELFFPLDQDSPESSHKYLKEVCLWETNLSNSSKLLKWYRKFDDEVIQVELDDSRNSTDAVKEIQTHLESLIWQRTTAPQCGKGFPLLCNPLTHAVEQYMNNHWPTTSMELNFHAELKAASKWRWSGDRLYLDMEESLDGRRKIAAEEILKTWKKWEEELLHNKIHSRGRCLAPFDVSGYIQVLEKYLRKAEDDLLEVEMATVSDEEQSAISYSSEAEDDLLEVETATVSDEEQSAISYSSVEAEDDLLEVETATVSDEEQSAISYSSEAEDDLLEVETATVSDEEQSAISYSSVEAEDDLLEVEMTTVSDEEQSAISYSSGTLVPRELVISGGENDPLGGTFITEYLRVYGHVLCCTDEPAALRVDFVLDPNGRIIPALSFGLTLYTDFEHLPLYCQENPERLWKLNDPQMYRGQIEIALVSNGQYVIRPREPVELETFKSRLRCLRWVKMSSC